MSNDNVIWTDQKGMKYYLSFYTYTHVMVWNTQPTQILRKTAKIDSK